MADLVARAAAEHADAVLVSQVVTQRDAHLSNTREMSAAFRAGFGPRRPLLVVGGPRFDPATAADLGVDKIFGRGTTPGEVASYLVHALAPEPGGSARDGARSVSARVGLTVTPAPVRARTATPTTAATWWTARTCSGCSATWRPRRASGCDGDEGLFASYSDVQFRAPVLAGDVIEATATVTAVGRRSRRARLRGPGGVPGRPGARRVGRRGARRADRRRHRDRHRRRAAAR